MLEDPALIDFKAKHGEKLLFLHRGLNLDDHVKNKKKNDELDDNFQNIGINTTPNIGTFKMKRIIGEIHGSMEDILDENEDEDFYLEDPVSEEELEDEND